VNTYPVYLKLKGRKCVVAGGGAVARRKVRSLLDSGAEVQVISPETGDELRAWAGNESLKIIADFYQPHHLDGAFLVVAATDDRDVNRRIGVDAHERHILCNIVDDPDISDFIVPATARRGGIAAAVSTSGKSPALARRLKNWILQQLPESYVILNEIMGALRSHPALKQGTPSDHKELWDAILDSPIPDKIADGDVREVESILSRIVGRRITLDELKVNLHQGGLTE
jgi:precorrin-2 dehydrogenase / sirohydrochlorin ferrochelatase